MKYLFWLVFVVGLVFGISQIVLYGYADASRCGSMGGLMTAEHECSTIFGTATFE